MPAFGDMKVGMARQRADRPQLCCKFMIKATHGRILMVTQY